MVTPFDYRRRIHPQLRRLCHCHTVLIGPGLVAISPTGMAAQKLLGKNKISVGDPIVDKVVQVLRAAGFADVAVES